MAAIDQLTQYLPSIGTGGLVAIVKNLAIILIIGGVFFFIIYRALKFRIPVEIWKFDPTLQIESDVGAIKKKDGIKKLVLLKNKTKQIDNFIRYPIKKGLFKKEIVPINGITIDEPIRPNTTLQKMSKLHPAFLAKGTITAGNAPGLNDGSASVIVTTASKAKKLGRKPIAVIEDYTTGHTDPDWFGLAPVIAVKKLMKQPEKNAIG